MEPIRDKVRRQKELEELSRGWAAQRLLGERMPWQPDDAGGTPKDLSDLPVGQQLLIAMVAPTADAVREWVSAAKAGKQQPRRRVAVAATSRPGGGPRPSALRWLEFSDPEAVAYLAARTALAAAMEGEKLVPAARAVGLAVIDHIDLTKLSVKHPKGYEGLTVKEYNRARSGARSSETRLAYIRRILEHEDSRSQVSSTELVHLGLTLIELVSSATELVDIELVAAGRGRKVYQLRPTELLDHWLTHARAHSALMAPIRLPMIVRPRRWRGGRDGGYLSGRSARLVKAGRDALSRQRLSAADISLVDEAVNHVQETAWKVNVRVLEVMREAWDRGEAIAKLPERLDRPLPERPDDIATNPEALGAWKREAAKVHTVNAKARSRRHTVLQRFWLAEKYAAETEVYFPHFADSRGRVYPLAATGIHPQSDDAGKALLEFAHGLPLGETGGFWLSVHIANLFGVDKVSFKDRVEWTHAHAAQLIDSALDPLDGARFWTTADSPWMALAAAFEFAGMLEQGDAYVSRLPISLDASNSGLQHFSALLRDEAGAREVNLVPQLAPADVYTSVGRLAQEIVDATPTITHTVGKGPDEKTITMPNPWQGGKVSRKIAKRPTMTFVYSATRYGVHDMILETLADLDKPGQPYLGGADNHAAALYLSSVLLDAIKRTVSAAAGGMEWLRRTARVAAGAGLPISWTAPDGLPVTQSYRIVKTRQILAHWRGRAVQLKVGEFTSELDKKKQANGIAPNFVHALDSAHLRAVARRAKSAGIDHLSFIHDSFGTHAARTDQLVDIIRDEFVTLYEGDPLATFRAEIAEQLPPEVVAKLPPLPPRGTFDIQQVRRARYAFA